MVLVFVFLDDDNFGVKIAILECLFLSATLYAELASQSHSGAKYIFNIYTLDMSYGQ
jgi:hypothetical protein